MSGRRIKWKTLDRSSLINMLHDLYPRVVDRPLEPKKLNSILRYQIRKNLPVRVSRKTDVNVTTGWVYVGGTYCSDLDLNRRSAIEVFFMYHPNDRVLTLNKKKFDGICHVFADVILHEIIHMHQARARRFKYMPDYSSSVRSQRLRAEQSYYGCYDEIDAYGFNVACELLDSFKGNVESAKKYICQSHFKGRCKSQTLKTYLKTFEYNYCHPVIKRLLKKSFLYLPKAEQGKPYTKKI